MMKRTMRGWALAALACGLGARVWSAVEAPAPASAYASPEFLAPAGDGAGVTRGLAQAGASGIQAARAISERLK